MEDSLATFIKNIRPIWGRLDTDLAAKAQALVEELARASGGEAWLAGVQGENAIRELYRDPAHGFILLAYTEREGLYRAPHDHGNGWVIYAVVKGEMEMATYALIRDGAAEPRLVRREGYRVAEGESRLFLPGDIHHTKCISDHVLVLRLTSCDLAIEKAAGRMHQYASQP